MQSSDIIVLTPPALGDASLAIAACRVGSRGVLDVEYCSYAVACAQLERLERFTTSPFGIKIGRQSGELFSRLLANFPSRLAWVLLAGGDHPELTQWVDHLRRQKVDVLLETTCLHEMILGEQLAVNGLVIKGHEAGGRVGAETSFILLQRWHAHVAGTVKPPLPVWVQGGVGLNTAGACLAGGAVGIVLDAQVLLARESLVGEAARTRLAASDGGETVWLGERLGEAYRVYARPGLPALEELRREEQRIADASVSSAERLEAWRQTVAKLVSSPTHQRGTSPETDPDGDLWLVGQDMVMAKVLSDRFGTVAGIIQGLTARARQHLESAARLKPLAEASVLAQRHKTRFPIVQGPMTRVSDVAGFAEAVAGAGGMPFLALALLRRTEAEKLLEETKARLADQSWGVGILGFVPPEIRQEQVEAIRTHRPPFALIAGGRPDQARELEKEGIPTYLHVPSPGLLRMFLREGARRFVFEGRECGGHVGPRTSFVLWDTVCEILLEHLGPAGKGDDLHIIFAGGIHDALSAAMVSTLAAALAERGVAIGVLMGTAYLFTQEAVASGAIVPRFQKEALACADTVLLESGPGHAIRCIKTPYFDVYEHEKRRLLQEGRSQEEIRKALEWMNIGRLRVASKGLDRATETSGSSRLVMLPDDEQFARGMYMIGQVATMRRRVVSMAELHEDVCSGSSLRLRQATRAGVADTSLTAHDSPPCDVAIVGMACFYPKASGLGAYWENILNGVNAISEIPATHWDWRLYYDPNPRARDKIISKWGGFLDDIPFDPLLYGITPNSLTSIEPLQLFLLESVRQALADAGYSDRPFNRERTAAILGIGGGGSPLAVAYGFRTCLPLLDTVPQLPVKSERVLALSDALLPEWTEDSFPGILLNVAVGRVANRFNFGGPNYSIDAACGSSLAAVQACVRELEMGTSDVAVAMGADTVQTPFAYMAFSKTHALSPRGRCRPFDAGADGIVLSEGIGAVILKRLPDAERDGDKIYAIIRGMGASSDGRDKGLTAPRPEGQLRALRRAYAKAGISPAQVEMVEAHGTGTVVGDETEAHALAQILHEAGAAPQTCALGSVKSMIGHAKCAAGIAGLIKTTLALHHKVLPPTLVEQPNTKGNFADGPLYLNTQARPWVHGAAYARCAGVSAFGFGGTNFHLVLEEYTNEFLTAPVCGLQSWPAELLVWRRPTRPELAQALDQCRDTLIRGASPRLADLASALWNCTAHQDNQPTLAIIASSLEDLQQKLTLALDGLRSSNDRWHDPRGVYFSEKPATQKGEIAFLFPGQGSQYPNMLAQLAMAFPEVRQALDEAERSLAGQFERPLGRLIYPPPAFTPEKEQEAAQTLTRADVAQPAVGAASLGMMHLLECCAIEPDFVAGHSYGEYTALCAAGAISESDFIRLSHLRGQAIVEATHPMPGSMAALDADAKTAEQLAAGVESVAIANLNAPTQSVVSGTEAGIQTVLERCREQGIRGQLLPVACAFHSPLVAPAREGLARALAQFPFSVPRRTVFANTTAAAYPADLTIIPSMLVNHLIAPVRFQAEIEAMYEAGARIFLEVGPQGVLTSLVTQILAGRPHLAVASDVKSRPGLVQLQHLLAQLLVSGLPVDLQRLFQGRDLSVLDLSRFGPDTGRPKYSPSTWMVNGFRNRPKDAPEPLRLGQSRQPSPSGIRTTPLPVADVASPTAMPNLVQPTNTAPEISATSDPAPPPAFQPGHHILPSGIPDLASAANGLASQVLGISGTGGEVAQVMLRFQELMARFLDTQKSVMGNYLLGTPSQPLPNSSPLPDASALAHPGANGLSPHPTPTNGSSPGMAPQSLTSTTPPTTGNGIDVNPVAAGRADRAAAPLDREWLSAQLLDLVQKRTGYPKDMLGLDLDLEADLGIDSIKRVEILGGLADSMGGNDSNLASNLEMEKLTTIKTLRGILDYLDGIRGSEVQRTPTAGGERPKPPPTEGSQLAVRRALVKLVDAPLPADASILLPRGTVLVTDDGRGIANELVGRLADFGQKTALIRFGSAPQEDTPSDVYYADLADPLEVDQLLKRLRRQAGPIAGLVHLLPLAEVPQDLSWADRIRREVKSLYVLARSLDEELRQGGANGGAVLLAATSLGGGFGFDHGPLPDSYFPGHGGIVGFVKCLAYEWPEVLVRVVDLHGDKDSRELADRLLGELTDRDGPLEVGYLGARRITWEPTPAPLAASLDRPPLLTKASTVLVTGGARGITAAVCLELAKRYQPNLVLVGRSPLPDEIEMDDTASLTAPSEIKSALIARHQREGRPVVPAGIEADYQRLLHQREIRANLARIRQTGARVHYFQVDVRDEQALGGLLDDIEQRFGHLHGVIHGAGVIEDKLLRDKTPESFDRVFSTKTDSAWILSRRLRAEQLKFCVFFASIASRYGNKGQSDYAAANETLSKLAIDLDRRWPCRVISIAWGPWSSIGMVADLEKHLVRRGLKLISPDEGPAFLLDELIHGRKGDTEVIIAGGAESAARPARGKQRAEAIAQLTE
jgi:acyl transferase domain-containing protein/NAD(P)H-dependent flavin oxidoreductase YrpB (nitropropane dioxygenase family)/NAD(P)-dependent dehydrogenase (short-subunit alcohol dehydrogenase family)